MTINQSTPATRQTPLKNGLLALGLMLFLALSFKIAGDLTAEDSHTAAISPTDSVFSTLQAPNVTTTSPTP